MAFDAGFSKLRSRRPGTRGQSTFEYVVLTASCVLLVAVVVFLLRGNLFGVQVQKIGNDSSSIQSMIATAFPTQASPLPSVTPTPTPTP